MDKKEFQGIMDSAIACEVEAYEFYGNVSAKVSDAGLKKLFQELAEEERGHQVALTSIKEKEIQNFTFASGADYHVAESVELPKLSLDMKPADAVALAMKKEEESMNMYSALSDCTTDAEKKRLFLNLAKMEEGHKVKLEEMYTQMAFPEVW